MKALQLVAPTTLEIVEISRGDDNACHGAGRIAQPPTPGLGPPGGMAAFMVPLFVAPGAKNQETQ